MEIKLDWHKYEQRLTGMIRSLEKSDISERNKKLIFRFRNDCVRQGLSKPRIVKLMKL